MSPAGSESVGIFAGAHGGSVQVLNAVGSGTQSVRLNERMEEGRAAISPDWRTAMIQKSACHSEIGSGTMPSRSKDDSQAITASGFTVRQ